jgi:F0F1-type ATP synthase delta subunit
MPPTLTDKQKKELEKIIEEITKEAKLVIEDYIKNPSDISGSVIQIHSDSPLIKDD